MKRIIAFALPTLVFISLLFISRYSPHQHTFYPKCPTFLIFKVKCFVCGATRCVYELTQGNLEHAARMNMLLVLALPFLLYEGTRAYLQFFFNCSLTKIPYPRWFWKFLVVLLLAFTIGRNML